MMISQNSKTDNKESKFSGKTMSEEELAEYNQAWIDIEESIAGLTEDL